MKAMMTKLVLLAAFFMVSGCNTWNGMGQDISTVGQKMQAKPKNPSGTTTSH